MLNNNDPTNNNTIARPVALLLAAVY